jgi:hypothetical protein
MAGDPQALGGGDSARTRVDSSFRMMLLTWERTVAGESTSASATSSGDRSDAKRSMTSHSRAVSELSIGHSPDKPSVPQNRPIMRRVISRETAACPGGAGALGPPARRRRGVR